MILQLVKTNRLRHFPSLHGERILFAFQLVFLVSIASDC